MKDILQELRAYLIEALGVTVYANWYPEKPNFPFVVARVESGALEPEAPIRNVSLELRCYAATEKAAHDLDLRLMDALTSYAGSTFEYFLNDQIGRLVQDPDTGWNYALSAYSTQLTE